MGIVGRMILGSLITMGGFLFLLVPVWYIDHYSVVRVSILPWCTLDGSVDKEWCL